MFSTLNITKILMFWKPILYQIISRIYYVIKNIWYNLKLYKVDRNFIKKQSNGEKSNSFIKW